MSEVSSPRASCEDREHLAVGATVWRLVVALLLVNTGTPVRLFAGVVTVADTSARIPSCFAQTRADTVDWVRFRGFELGLSVLLPPSYVRKIFDSRGTDTRPSEDWWRDDRPFNSVSLTRSPRADSPENDPLFIRCDLIPGSTPVHVKMYESTSQQVGHEVRVTYVVEVVWATVNGDLIVLSGYADSESERRTQMEVARNVLLRSCTIPPD